MYVHSVTMWNEKYFVRQCTEMSNMDLVTYIMSTVYISIVGQIQDTQHNTLLVSV